MIDRRHLALSIDNALAPERLVRVPRAEWPAIVSDPPPREVWRSRGFVLMVYPAPGEMERLTVCRTAIQTNGRFADGISWDDLQRLKSECGRGDREAVELYPRDRDVVNVGNLRHLWVVKDGLPFAWRAPEPESVD